MRFWGHVVYIGVFRDRGAIHVRPPRDLRPGHSLTVQSPDILLFGHRYRHCPFLPEGRRLQRRRICFWVTSREYTGTAGRCLFPSRRSYGAVPAGNRQPILRKNSTEIASEKLKQNGWAYVCLLAGLADKGVAGHSAGRARDAGLVLAAFVALDFPLTESRCSTPVCDRIKVFGVVREHAPSDHPRP